MTQLGARLHRSVFCVIEKLENLIKNQNYNYQPIKPFSIDCRDISLKMGSNVVSKRFILVLKVYQNSELQVNIT